MTQDHAVNMKVGEPDGAFLSFYFPFLLLYSKAAQRQQSAEEKAQTQFIVFFK